MDRITFAVEDRGISYPSASILYRARIYTVRDRKDLFSLDEMGTPPPEVTPAARANRAGHPVLYMASDMQTALAEVRAWKGAPLSVAKMKLSREYRILDLIDEYSIDSPFFVESLKWVLETNRLMNRFADELSRPVMPHEAEILYRPTQNLCDLVKAAGCDGIAYPSAMGPGHNVVLFDPYGAKPVEVSHCRVEELSFTSRDLEPYEPPHEEVPWSG
jgi:RES domain-containing protein